MNWVTKLKSVWSAARIDLREANWIHLLAFWATVVIFAIDVPTHEALLGIIGGDVLRSTGSPLWVGLSVAFTSLAIETVMSAGISINLRYFARATKEWQRLFFGEPKPEARSRNTELTTLKSKALDALDNAVLAITLGPSVVVLKVHGHAHSRRLREDIRTGFLASVFVASFNFVLAASIAGAAVASKFLGFPLGSTILIDIATNPFTYVGLLIVRQIAKYVSAQRTKQETTETSTRSNAVIEADE